MATTRSSLRPATPVQTLVFTIVVMTTFPAGGVAQSCDVSWNKFVSGDWSDPTKWSTGAVPTLTQFVCIETSGGSPYTITVDVTPAVRGLRITSPDVTLINNAEFVVTGGAGLVEFISGSVWTPTSPSSPRFRVEDGAELHIGVATLAGDFAVENASLSLATAHSMEHGARIALKENSTISGNIPVDLEVVLLEGAQVTAQTSFSNYGMLSISGFTDNNPTTLTVVNGALTNGADAELRFNDNFITLHADLTNYGEVSSDALVTMPGKVFTQNADTLRIHELFFVTGGGAFVFAGGAFETNDQGVVSSINIVNSNLEIVPFTTGATNFLLWGECSFNGWINRGQRVELYGGDLVLLGSGNTNVTATSPNAFLYNYGELILTSQPSSGDSVSLTLPDNVLFNDGSLSMSGDVTFAGTLNNRGSLDVWNQTHVMLGSPGAEHQNGGEMRVRGDVVVDGGGQSFTQSPATPDPLLSVSGSFVVKNGASFSLLDGSVYGVAVVDGVIEIGEDVWRAFDVVLGGATTLAGTIANGNQTVTVDSGATITVADGPFTNGGIFEVRGSSADATRLLGNITNDNNLVFQPGNTTVIGDLSNTGHLEIEVDANVTLATPNGNHTNAGGLKVAGSLTVDGANQTFNQNGDTLQVLSSFTVSSGASFNFKGGATRYGRVTIDDAALNIGATATGEATFLIEGSSSLSGATVAEQEVLIAEGATVTATTGFTNGGNLALIGGSGSPTTFDVPGGVLANTGTIELAAGNVTVNAIVNNQGDMHVQEDAEVTFGKSGGVFTNRGFATISGTLLVSNASAVINDTDGTLTITGTVSLNAATVQNRDGGLIEGVGTLIVSAPVFTNAGHINPGGPVVGALSIIGNMTQVATGAINLQIGGTTNGTVDNLSLLGNATLGGNLNVTFTNGFSPNLGDTFVPLTYGSVTGTFGEKHLSPLANGLQWSVLIGDQSTTLNVSTILTGIAVNSTGDVGDTNAGDGTCETAPGNGVCTLRAAIQEANADAALDTITFSIPGSGPHAIQPTTSLPTITESVFIDGYTQLGAQLNTNGPGQGTNAVLMIELDGSNLGSGSGLQIQSSGSTVRGLAINNVPNNGDGIVMLFGNGNRIQGNFIGTDVTGAEAAGNDYGLVISASAQYNVIGTDGDGMNDPAERNVISGNRSGGILMQRGPVNGQTDHNVIAGNLIGTDASGTVAVGNFRGILISTGPRFNRIGSDGNGQSDDAERNVISGNVHDGLQIVDNIGAGTTENIIAGNYIGTDISGGVALGNGFGIRVNTSNNVIGQPGNVVSGNRASGVLLTNGATGNSIRGNLIGLDVSGTDMVPNGTEGIHIAGGTNNTIGGPQVEDRNVISGNETGVVMAPGSNDNHILGNYIGADITGTIPLPNTVDGVGIGGSRNVIGGTASGAGNIIAAHPSNAVLIEWWDDDNPVPQDNVIQGNTIGQPALGLPDEIPGQGISINNAIGTIVGGTAAGAANQISGNGQNGIVIDGAQSTGNQALSNAIFDNGELGIDLVHNNTGEVTPNDPSDVDIGPNELQNAPIVDGFSSMLHVIGGTLNSIPSTEFTLQLFATAQCDPSTYGEGEYLLKSVSLSTDAGGDLTFQESIPFSVDASAYITATATNNQTGSTSEFSSCYPAGVEWSLLGGTVIPGANILADAFEKIAGGSGNGSVVQGFTILISPEATEKLDLLLCRTTKVTLTANDQVRVACGSAYIEVETGPIEVAVSNDLQAVVPAGAVTIVRLTGDNKQTIENLSPENTDPIKLVSGGQEIGTIEAGETILENTLLVKHGQVIRPRHLDNRDLFLLDGTLVLNGENNGFDPAAESVTLAFGSFHQTIPAGGFTPIPPVPLPGIPEPLSYLFVSGQPGIALMSILPNGDYAVLARRLDLGDLDVSQPVPFTLGVGDDIASVSLLFDANGRLVDQPPMAAVAGDMGAPPVSDWPRAVMAWPNTATVTPGGEATYALVLGPRGEMTDRSVRLECAGLPPGVSCDFGSDSFTVKVDGSVVVLTVETTGELAAHRVQIGFGTGMPWIPLVLGVVLSIGLSILQPKRFRHLAVGTAASCAMISMALFAGCSEDPTGVADSLVSTPAGLYEIEVIADAGDLTYVTPVTLVVTTSEE